jgi:hypothetical protein
MKAMFAESAGYLMRDAVHRARSRETIVHSVACVFLFAPVVEISEEGGITSMGRMYACISHALLAEVDQYCGIEATVSDGPEDVGCVIHVLFEM